MSYQIDLNWKYLKIFKIDKLQNLTYGTKYYLTHERIDNCSSIDISHNTIKIINIILPELLNTFVAEKSNILKFKCYIPKSLVKIDISYNDIKKLKLNHTPDIIWYDRNIKNKKTFYKESFYYK